MTSTHYQSESNPSNSVSNLVPINQTNPETVVNIEENSLTEDNVLLNGQESNQRQTLNPPNYSHIPGTVPLYCSRSNDPPPTYDEVVNPNSAPPSYQSLFGQVREAQKSANGFIDFVRKIVVLILGTLGVTVIIGFTVLMPFTMIFVGVTHMNDCKAENIPLFLLIGGTVWAIKNFWNFWSNCRRSNISDPEREALFQAWQKKREATLNFVLFAWFVTGCFFVYRIYPPNYDDPKNIRYCNRVVYFYAFWLVTATFIVFGLFMGCLCCLTISSMFVYRR